MSDQPKLDHPQAIEVEVNDERFTEDDKETLVELLREVGFDPVHLDG